MIGVDCRASSDSETGVARCPVCTETVGGKKIPRGRQLIGKVLSGKNLIRASDQSESLQGGFLNNHRGPSCGKANARKLSVCSQRVAGLAARCPELSGEGGLLSPIGAFAISRAASRTGALREGPQGCP